VERIFTKPSDGNHRGGIATGWQQSHSLFFNHVSKHKDIKERFLVELAPNYKTTAAYLVQMLVATFKCQ
jgi:hypothetical protein